jgi:O-succinylbenzoic acid--CoA ligase
MPELVAFAAAGSPSFLDTIERIWDDGDAFCPYDPRLPLPAIDRLFDALAPTVVVDADGTRHRRPQGRPVEAGDALVVATSGSTGTPKGVVHTHASIAASAVATSTALGVRPDTDRWLCCLPLAHVAGLSVVFRARHFAMGLDILPRFDADTVRAAAVERGATLTTVVPTALTRFDPLLYRRIVVGGAAPPAVLPANAVTSYGLTETGSAVAYDGQALSGVELRIVDGEIQVRGPMLLRAYRRADADVDPFDTDRWFATGDAGALSDDGRLEVFGRRGELIISGGENVWPTAVEAVLATHPDVAEVAVVGRADQEWGQRVAAVVVPADATRPPGLEALRDWVKAELAPWAAPRELDLRAQLPRIGIGKIDRAALRETGSATWRP